MIKPEYYLIRHGLTRWLRHGTNLKATMIPQLPGPCYLATYSSTSFHLTMLEELERHQQPIVWETIVILNILMLSGSTLFVVQMSESQRLSFYSRTIWHTG